MDHLSAVERALDVTPTPWQSARAASDRLAADCREAIRFENEESYNDDDFNERRAELPNPDDVLSIDVETRVSVVLTLGGPTVFVEYVFRGGDFLRAEYVTTDNERGEMLRVHMNDADAETIAEAYVGGIDMLAVHAGGEQ